jgi:hypothetical protein
MLEVSMKKGHANDTQKSLKISRTKSVKIPTQIISHINEEA